MDITQSVDPRNNIFLELMNMSRNALFAGKNVCMPHAPSVGAGIPWVAHPISKCDTCTLFDHHTSGLYNKDTRKNFTDPNCMFCFCVSMQLHISNTEHVQCACNDYKLQELTFKCLNLYFVRVIRTLKGGIVGLQIVFKCLT